MVCGDSFLDMVLGYEEAKDHSRPQIVVSQGGHTEIRGFLQVVRIHKSGNSSRLYFVFNLGI